MDASTVGAAAHAKADALIAQADLVEEGRELPDEAGQRALRFGRRRPQVGIAGQPIALRIACGMLRQG